MTSKSHPISNNTVRLIAEDFRLEYLLIHNQFLNDDLSVVVNINNIYSG